MIEMLKIIQSLRKCLQLIKRILFQIIANRLSL